MPRFRTSDATFNYIDEGTGIPLVFQHGLGGDVNQPRTFVVPGVRLVSFDARGHGGTIASLDPARLTFSSFADDLCSLLEHLTIHAAVIGGISMGAGVALNFALRFPDRTLGLILCRPAWLNERSPKNLQAYPQIASLIEHEGVIKGRMLFEDYELFQQIRNESVDSAHSLLRQFERPGADQNFAVLDRMPKDVPNNDPADWKTIRVPTLILGNRQDPIHPIEYAQLFSSLIPSSTFHEVTSKSIDPAGHVNEVATAISLFLQQEVRSVHPL
jgi:pimeloyl-ACP methyl ester carboxylesterase